MERWPTAAAQSVWHNRRSAPSADRCELLLDNAGDALFNT